MIDSDRHKGRRGRILPSDYGEYCQKLMIHCTLDRTDAVAESWDASSCVIRNAGHVVLNYLFLLEIV